MSQKILIVEDESNIAKLLQYNLEQDGYSAFIASTGEKGMSMLHKNSYDLLILDIMLPEISGIEICRMIRSDETLKSLPILMLTAKGTEADKVVGLELGADDYMVKPFSVRELMARLKAILRRSTTATDKTTVLKAGSIEMNIDSHIVKLDTKQIDLTSKEYNLLKTLMLAKGRVLSREKLLDEVWGYEQSLNIETRTVDIHIGQLRKKVKTESKRIVTVMNEGYRLDREES